MVLEQNTSLDGKRKWFILPLNLIKIYDLILCPNMSRSQSTVTSGLRYGRNYDGFTFIVTTLTVKKWEQHFTVKKWDRISTITVILKPLCHN